MILILSENNDQSTNDVIDWLIHYNKKFIRLNTSDEITLSIFENKTIIVANEKKISLDYVDSYWYRRGIYNFKTKKILAEFNNFFKEENIVLIEYLDLLLCQKKSISSRNTGIINKLIVNEVARKLNIKRPSFYFLNNKTDLLKLKDRKLLTKTFSNSGVIRFKNNHTAFFHNDILDVDIVNDKFRSSYLQEYIEKKYELRIFYLHGKFWSMTIFSQKDEKTKTDFRNYNDEKPNRNVPYKLPIEIEDKLDCLMKELNLNSGSIDMIVTPDNEYYFLEVNPVGQFGMTSNPCNYNLEKEIAEYL